VLKYFFIIFILSIQICAAQVVSITRPANNIAYADGFNEISINVKGYSFANLIVSTNNGTIKNKAKGWFDFSPTDTGFATIKVQTKQKNKVLNIGEVKMIIKNTEPKFFIGQSCGGQVKKEMIMAQDYVRINTFELGCVFYYPFTLDSFFVQILRDSSIAFEKWNKGNQLNEEIKSGFRNTKAHDVIIITNITGQTINRKRRLDNAVNFEIID
jgi:hypothetical protein